MRSVTVNGPAVRALREERGLTGERLAARLSKMLNRRVCPTTIYKIERGSRQPGAALFAAIVTVLDADRSDLLVSDAKAAA